MATFISGVTDFAVAADGLPSNEHLALRVMPLPRDLNPAGDVFGGWIMSMVDIAGPVPAIRHAAATYVTVDEFHAQQTG